WIGRSGRRRGWWGGPTTPRPSGRRPRGVIARRS
ncbi:MAG: hypothetical protein AVDCRST_MAG78-1106, partial [uncultured Rubrobacteraceae bacterium]